MKFKLKSDQDRKVNINMEAISAYVSRWKPGTEFDIEIVRRQKRVSDPMRKYFFGCVLPIFLEAYGYEPEEALDMHKHLKCTFFQVQPDSHGFYRDSDIPSVFGNNSDLPIERKQAYVEWIKRKSAEQGAYTPDPGE